MEQGNEGKLNLKQVAAQLSMNKFPSSRNPPRWFIVIWCRVLAESKSIILIDARPSPSSSPPKLLLLYYVLSICDLFDSAAVSLTPCLLPSLSLQLHLPLSIWYSSCFSSSFFSVFLCLEINDVNGRKI